MFEQITEHSQAFDYAIALSDWLSHWHEGQYSEKYAAMSKIYGEYKLVNHSSIDYDAYDSEDETTFNMEDEPIIMIYKELNEDNWKDAFNMFCDYMDNEWYDDI